MNLDFLTQLRALARSAGPPGAEGPVADHIASVLDAAGWQPRRDPMGNVVLQGSERCRGLVCAHMDQVGFMVSRVEASRARCLPLGDPALPGRSAARVLANGATKTTGWLEPVGDEASAALRAERLDVIEVGDQVVFADAWQTAPNGVLSACALDNRVGCNLLLDLATDLAWHRPDVWLAWTVGEELDCAGALHAVAACDPEWLLAVDVTPAGPDRSDTGESDIALGAGPAVTLLDGEMVAHPRLLAAITAASRAVGVELQHEVVADGATEAGTAQGTLGIPALAVLVPIEDPHSPVETVHLGDVRGTRALLAAALAHHL